MKETHSIEANVNQLHITSSFVPPTAESEPSSEVAENYNLFRSIKKRTQKLGSIVEPHYKPHELVTTLLDQKILHWSCYWRLRPILAIRLAYGTLRTNAIYLVCDKACILSHWRPRQRIYDEQQTLLRCCVPRWYHPLCWHPIRAGPCRGERCPVGQGLPSH